MSDRCQIWVTIRKADLENASQEVLDFIDEAMEVTDETDYSIEYTFEDVRYPDDSVSPLDHADIPYKMVNSAGEYPEGTNIFDGKESFYVTMLESEIICTVDRKTGQPDVDRLGRIRDYLEAERGFEEYLKKGKV